MERICYILGAGFSAPLGLPLMSNFLEKSKDMFLQQKDKYRNFMEVFDRIINMHSAKTYYNSDLLNIEEILSILEIESALSSKKKKIVKYFIEYIQDVINYYTPKMGSHDPIRKLISTRLYGSDEKWTPYGCFVSNLFNFIFEYSTDYNRIIIKLAEKSNNKYSVITFNYDMVLENILTFLGKYLQYSNESRDLTDERFKYIASSNEYDPNWSMPHLAKLHGSVDRGNIVPPTWNKSLNNKISDEWKRAHEILNDSTQIRFIGYSLPVSDSYVKYLLKSALIHDDKKLKNLHRIDILCLDDDKGSVKDRYREFIEFKNAKYLMKDVKDYLGLLKTAHDGMGHEKLECNKLEICHDQLFTKASFLH